MKKFLTLFLALVAMLTVFAVVVSADEPAPLTEYTVFLDGKTNTTLYTSAEGEGGVVTYTKAGANLKAAIEKSATFQSLDTKTATVDADGKVTPVKTGVVLIRVWDAEGEKLGDYTVHVVKKTVTDVTIVAPTKTYYVGDKIPLTDVQVKFSYNNGDSDSTKVATTEYTLTYDEGVVDAGGRLLIPGDHIKVYVTSVNNDKVSTYFEVRVITNVVKSLTLSIAGGGSHFSEGSVLPGLNVIATSTNGSESTVAASQYTIYISSDKKDWEAVKGSRLLKTTDKYIKVHYNGVDSNIISISVTATSSDEGDDNTGDDTSDCIGVVNGTFKTKNYRVGDKIDWTGITVTLKKEGTTVTTLTSDLLLAYSGISDSPFARKFTKDDIKGTGKTDIIIVFEYEDNDYQIPVTGLTVTDSLGLLSVYAIDALVMVNKTYVTGQTISIDDINYVVYSSSASNSKVIMGEELDNYVNEMSLQVLTSTGALKSSKKTTIEDTDLFQKDGQDYVNVRFYIDTKYVNTTIPVSDPDVSLYYDGKFIESFSTIDEAINAVEALSTTTYPPVNLKSATIKITSDEKITTTLNVERRIEIDLNGKKLTMDSDSIDPNMSASYCFVTITNSSSTAGTLIYDDEDLSVILKKSETISFGDDYDEEDLLPGIYTLTLDIADGGKVEVTPKADKNDEVIIGHGNEFKIVITPDDGYMVDEIAVGKTKITSSTTGYSEKSGVVTYKFTVDEDNNGDTITIEFTEADPFATWDNPFTDVTKSKSYYNAVAFVNIHNLLNGISDTKFSPTGTLTRAQFVTILGRLAGIDDDLAKELYPATTTKYSDVRKGDSRYSYYSYAVPYIIWATDEGLIEGHGGNEKGTFGPEDPITHQQMYVIMQRYADKIEGVSTAAGTQTLNFTDKGSIASWAVNAVKYAQKMDFIVTTGTNKISPTTNAQRYEIAMLLQKFCGNVLQWEETGLETDEK